MVILTDGAGRKFVLVWAGLVFILITGILKHFLQEMPADAMITGSVGLVLGYFGINFAQKTKELKYEQTNGISKD